MRSAFIVAVSAASVLAGAPEDPCTDSAFAALREELARPDLCPVEVDDCGCHKVAATLPLCATCLPNTDGPDRCAALQRELGQDCTPIERCDLENVRSLSGRLYPEILCPDGGPCACRQLALTERACSACFPITAATEEAAEDCQRRLSWDVPVCDGETIALHTTTPAAPPRAPTTDGPLPAPRSDGSDCTLELVESLPARLSAERLCPPGEPRDLCACTQVLTVIPLCRPCRFHRIQRGESRATFACEATRRYYSSVCGRTTTNAPDATRPPRRIVQPPVSLPTGFPLTLPTGFPVTSPETAFPTSAFPTSFPAPTAFPTSSVPPPAPTGFPTSSVPPPASQPVPTDFPTGRPSFATGFPNVFTRFPRAARVSRVRGVSSYNLSPATVGTPEVARLMSTTDKKVGERSVQRAFPVGARALEMPIPGLHTQCDITPTRVSFPPELLTGTPSGSLGVSMDCNLDMAAVRNDPAGWKASFSMLVADRTGCNLNQVVNVRVVSGGVEADRQAGPLQGTDNTGEVSYVICATSECAEEDTGDNRFPVWATALCVALPASVIALVIGVGVYIRRRKSGQTVGEAMASQGVAHDSVELSGGMASYAPTPSAKV